MTTIDPQAAATAVSAEASASGAAAALADWLTSTDHKKVGRLYIGTALLVGIAVVGLGMVLGVERIDATANIIDAGAAPQLFSLYRIVLTLGFVAPLLLGLAIAIVPLQLGARAMALPRLAVAGFWSWLIGTGLVIGAIAANGGPGGGSAKMVDLFLSAQVLAVAGLVAGAISVATSVLTTRAPGMNLRRAPLFAWSSLVGALGLILMLPVLAGALVLLYIDHRGPRTAFGGNEGINGWIRFALTQPQTLVYAVPGLGAALEIVVTASRRRLKLRGVALAGLGLTLSAAIAGVSQVSATIRPNFTDLSAGQVINDVLPYALFNLLPLLAVVIVLGITVLAAASGRIRPTGPVLFGVFGMAFVALGLAANAVALVGDARLDGTVFDEAAWIAVSYGAVLTALGGIAFWGPKLWGRTIGDAKTIPLALAGALGTVLAAGSYFIAGFAKQPADSTTFDYGGPEKVWNIITTVGHGLVLFTVFAFVLLALSAFSGDQSNAAGDDPWDGQTLEWATASPAPTDNFAELHVVASSAPLLDVKPTASTGGHR